MRRPHVFSCQVGERWGTVKHVIARSIGGCNSRLVSNRAAPPVKLNPTTNDYMVILTTMLWRQKCLHAEMQTSPPPPLPLGDTLLENVSSSSWLKYVIFSISKPACFFESLIDPWILTLSMCDAFVCACVRAQMVLLSIREGSWKGSH